MIPQELNAITEADLTALISNGVAEGRTIDYKLALPGNSDGDKKEFLADVSSFANTSGGDLVFGMDEAAGLPTAVTGLQSADLDAEIRRLDSILAAGLSPRIRYSIRNIPTSSGIVLVLRADRSWSGPHRVVFAGHDKFFGRNSAGKYPLDVNELRAAFNLSATAIERIRAFRADRLIALSNNLTPLPFVDAPKIVLHCIPLEAFASGTQYNVLPVLDETPWWTPMNTTACNRRLNLEGVLNYGVHNLCFAYTQLYRTGVIEAVQGNLLAREQDDMILIPSQTYEDRILGYLGRCFQLLQTIGCGGPVVVALSLLGTKGLTMGVSENGFYDAFPITEQNIVLPETVVEELTTPAEKIMKPLFDLIWNACGYRESLNFDSEGKWRHKGAW